MRLNSLSSSKSGLVSIDILRGAASLGVFYYHLHMGTMLANYSHIKLFEYTNTFGANYAVPLFFLISGYCIHLSNLKYINNGQPLPLKQYLKRRLLRIYPAYLVAVLFSLLVNAITHFDTPASTTDFLVHIFLLQGFSALYFNCINLVLWTISIEVMLYILYPLFFYLRKKLSLSKALGVTLMVSCISIAFFSIKGNTTTPEYYCVFNLWFAWCCGAFIAEKNTNNNTDLKKPVYKAIYCIIFLAFLFETWFQPWWLNDFYYQLKILIWTGPLVYILNQESVLKRSNSFIVKIITAIGLSSYSLYLFHQPLIALKNFMAHQYLPQHFQITGVVLGIFFIPVITWLSYRYIEMPFMAKKTKQ